MYSGLIRATSLPELEEVLPKEEVKTEPNEVLPKEILLKTEPNEVLPKEILLKVEVKEDPNEELKEDQLPKGTPR
jgi:hypothetical protein